MSLRSTVDFLLYQWLQADALSQRVRFADHSRETFDAVLDTCERIAREKYAPFNRLVDIQEPQFDGEKVILPQATFDAQKAYAESGMLSAAQDYEMGGMQLPYTIEAAANSFFACASISIGTGMLTTGNANLLMVHGTPLQKEVFARHEFSGRFAGTMCLSEPQAGSSLGDVATRAVPDGGDFESEPLGARYRLTGNKMWISAGEHELTENIIHLVLAKIPGPDGKLIAGTRGISLFIVPKMQVQADGGVGEHNRVVCSAIEHKMGIKASATAVINFEDSIGHMIAEPNKGLEAMFTFMNTARVGTAVQGIAHAELSYQGALAYAKERRSMRALSGKKEPEQVADAIIHHADVRRMLLTQKAIAEGGRAMIYFAAQYSDHMVNSIAEGDEKKYKHWDDKLGFLTPILKGFLTELGLEAANLGMQVFGGHGYIKEHGMEQIARDARIATLYEGTTGIQSLDLLGRKVLVMTRGKAVREFTGHIAKFAIEHVGDAKIRAYAIKLGRLAAEWNVLTTRIMLGARKDRDVVGAASYHFLMYSGYVTMAYFWALQAAVASKKLAEGGAEKAEFYTAKLYTARFYFDHLLPRAEGHASSMTKPARSLMKMPVDSFVFE